MPFQFERLEIPEVILVKPKVFEDGRGFFMETYKRSQFKANCVPEVFVQDNYSHSERGVLRGLHYQIHPRAQAKLVGVMQGEIYDVAVDIRLGSPTYGKCIDRVLSSQNHHMLYIPMGFAHGFYVLSSEADVVYKVTDEYAPEFEQGILWNDPVLGIDWPIQSQSPILSKSDAQLPFLSKAHNNFVY